VKLGNLSDGSKLSSLSAEYAAWAEQAHAEATIKPFYRKNKMKM
jgi:hypothetical protein